MLRFSGNPSNMSRRLSRQRDLIRTTAKHSFAARRHTELKRLSLNAVPLGDNPELPRLSSRGFRSENTLGGGLPPTRSVACFTRSGVVLAVRYPTFRFAPRGAKCLPSVSPIQLRKTQVASEALCPLRPSLCGLCVFANDKRRSPNTQITQSGCRIEPLLTCGLLT